MMSLLQAKQLEAADYNQMVIFGKWRVSTLAEKKILTPRSSCSSDPMATKHQMMAHSKEKSSNLSYFSRFELLKKQSFAASQARLVLNNSLKSGENLDYHTQE